ncbi:hypothetical protein A3744_24825 [Oleiphilus sp. HI0073]|nr:hypothetical protein A3744_24825 [Oleiphilus sp. HI0073]
MDLLLALIALLQSVIAVVSGQPNEALKDFGARLGIYLKQIAEFVSFENDDMPFPFSDWPDRENGQISTESPERTDSNG